MQTAKFTYKVINELKANIAKIETTSGEVNVNTFGNDIDVTTTSGNINITYQSETISNQIDLVSNSGNITLKVKPTLAFLLKIYDTKGEYRKDNGIDIEWLDELIENPYKVLGGDKVVSVTTDGNLNILSV